MRAKKVPRWYVVRDIQLLIRTFPSETITVRRPRRVYTPGHLGQQRWVYDLIYRGEALVIPSGGGVADYGLGSVEDKTPTLLIPGHRDIRQTDRLTLGGREYEVEFEPNHWHAFLQVRLSQWQQGT